MDGFTGNITLKLIEGVSSRALRLVTETANTNARGRLGSWLIGPAMQRLRDAIDPEGPGGAYMLGLRQLGVVAHGRFSGRGFAPAIDVAARGVQHDVIGRTRAALQQAGALGPAPGRDGHHPERADGPSEATATVST